MFKGAEPASSATSPEQENKANFENGKKT